MLKKSFRETPYISLIIGFEVLGFSVSPLLILIFSFFLALGVKTEFCKNNFFIVLAFFMAFLALLKVPVSDQLYLMDISRQINYGNYELFNNLYKKELVFYALFLISNKLFIEDYLIPSFVFVGYISIFFALKRFFQVDMREKQDNFSSALFIALNPVIYNNAGHLSRQFLATSFLLLIASYTYKKNRLIFLNIIPALTHLTSLIFIFPFRKLNLKLAFQLILITSILLLLFSDSLIYVLSRLKLSENESSDSYALTNFILIYLLGTGMLFFFYRKLLYRLELGDIYFYTFILFVLLLTFNFFQLHFWATRFFLFYLVLSVFLISFIFSSRIKYLISFFFLVPFFIYNLNYGPFEHEALYRGFINYYD